MYNNNGRALGEERWGLNHFMKCSCCGTCCQKTKMMLSFEDVKRLERLGYDCQKFIFRDRQGFFCLQNDHGHCFFYDVWNHSCKVYKDRPLGCHIYPVIYQVGKEIRVDDICPMKYTVSKRELKRKGKELSDLIQRLSQESKVDFLGILNM
jgi:Fe-S-cluster containining protein